MCSARASPKRGGEGSRGLPSNPSFWAERALLLSAGLLFLVLCVDAARLETPTVDEFAHLPAGAVYLDQANFTLFAKNPPLFKMLMALPLTLHPGLRVPAPEAGDLAQGWGPWRYAERFSRANARDFLGLFFPARVVVALFGLGTGALLALWAAQLFGRRAAALTTTLFLLTPVVLAHAHLATVDVGCMFGVLLCVYLLRAACKRPAPGRFALAGIAWGAALSIKYTALLLAPAIFLIVLVWRQARPGRAVFELALVSICALVTVNLGMGFKGSFTPLGSFPLVSGFGQALQDALPAALPVPLPEDYVTGFDAVKLDTERGEFGSYLLGEWSQEGHWYHDPIAFLSKTPLPILALLLAGVAFPRRFFSKQRLPARELATLLIPLVALGAALIGANRAKLGIRYLLPLLPFLYILIAGIFAGLRGRAAFWVPALSLAWLAVTIGLTHPSYLSHFNLAAGTEARGHRILIDSNLDWGQDLYRLPDALAGFELDSQDAPVFLLYFGHVDPGQYGIDYRLVPTLPVKGLVAVSVNYLMGYPYPARGPDGQRVEIDPDHARWLRDERPDLRLGSIWIFDRRNR